MKIIQHVVNDHHIIRKSHDITKMCISMYHLIGLKQIRSSGESNVMAKIRIFNSSTRSAPPSPFRALRTPVTCTSYAPINVKLAGGEAGHRAGV